MVNESETADESTEASTVLSQSQIKVLKIAIGVMSFLLVVGFVLMLVGIYYQSLKMSKRAEDSVRMGLQRQIDSPVPLMNLPLKPGTQLTNILADQGRLILHLRAGGTDELVVIDLASGWQQQRIILTPPQQ
jgi:hypothetical protein